MKQKHKKVIAKEIIILTSIVIIGLLLLSFFYLKNLYFKNKLKNYTNEITNLKHQIDSVEAIPRNKLIKSIFLFNNNNNNTTQQELTKTVSINCFILSNVMDSLFKEKLVNFIPPIDGVIFSNKSTNRIVPPPPDDEWGEMVFVKGVWEIYVDELGLDSSMQKNLIDVYTKLTDKKYISVNYDEFISTLKGIQFSPQSPIWRKYQRNLKEKNELEIQLSKTKYKILSASEINDNGIQVFFILIILIYPVRLFILLILWAFRTLKENKNE